MVRRGVAGNDRTRKYETSHQKQRGSSPRFYKLLSRNNSKFMYLPPMFAKKVEHLTNQETQIEDSSGKQWSVTLSLIDGSLAFKMGWEKFSQDHGLKKGHLLVFKYKKESHFTVSIFPTSAYERTNFNNEMRRRKKKRRVYQATASEDEAYQTDKSILASGDEFQNRKTKLAVENAGFGVSEQLPISVDVEDPICMINKSDWYHEEHRSLFYDLSFEMENKKSDADKCGEAVITMLGPHTETEQHDGNLDNAPDAKLPLSCNRVLELINPMEDDAVEQTKTTAEDAQMVVVETDPITSNTGDISIDKLVTALDAKTALSHTEIADEIRKKVDDTQMSPHSCQAGGHSGDVFMNKFYEKPSDNSKMKKGMSDNVCSVQGGISAAFGKLEPLSLSPSIGGSKIAEGEHVAKRKFGEFFVSSSTVKNPLGLHAIKKEVEMEDKANVFHQGSCGDAGMEPSVMWNQPQMVSPLVVKVEPDLPYETGQSDTINPSSVCPFTVEVENQLYLEVPVLIMPSRGRRSRAQTSRAQTQRIPMIVYLRNSVGRVWPVVYREYVGGRAFTVNWSKFCEQNNIKPGDRCRFEAEDITSFVYRVNVARGSA